MLCFRVGDFKSATVSSQLTKMKTAKMKKMQVVNLLFLPFNCPSTENIYAKKSVSHQLLVSLATYLEARFILYCY